MRLRSISICTVCGELSQGIESIGRNCPRISARESCRGVMATMLQEGDWRKCEEFETEDDRQYRRCENAGWLPTRRF